MSLFRLRHKLSLEDIEAIGKSVQTKIAEAVETTAERIKQQVTLTNNRVDEFEVRLRKMQLQLDEYLKK